MALNPVTLKNELLARVLATPPATSQGCAQGWADAYRIYAGAAQSCGVPGIPLGAALDAARDLLEASLVPIFTGGTDPASTASGLAVAFQAFWLAPPIPFAGVTPGVVTAVAGTAALQAGLLASWVPSPDPWPTAGQAATTIATLLNTFTHTVVVTHAPPSACALPLL